MKSNFSIYLAAALLASTIACTDSAKAQTTEGERGTKAGLTTVLNKGIEEKGLTMEEKWSHDVVVCKRTQMTGSRFFLKVCHTRGEWRAMRANAWESVDYQQRVGFN